MSCRRAAKATGSSLNVPRMVVFFGLAATFLLCLSSGASKAAERPRTASVVCPLVPLRVIMPVITPPSIICDEFCRVLRSEVPGGVIGQNNSYGYFKGSLGEIIGRTLLEVDLMALAAISYPFGPVLRRNSVRRLEPGPAEGPNKAMPSTVR
jgi:hypothetical protein